MKRWFWLAALLALALLGYVAAGPYLTVRAIREAVKTEDASALARHVDFPALRASLKLQVDDRIVREAGAEAQSSLLGAFGIAVATGLAGGIVDAMVTPVGLGALMEGRKLWNRGSGVAPPSRGDTSQQAEPLPEPVYGFESTSRVTARVATASGEPIVLVLTRDGMRWRLSDIRLPR